MSLEAWNLLVSLCTVAVLLAAAIAALIQLGHIRSSNELSTFSEIFELWYTPSVQRGITCIHKDLERLMQDPDFRRDLDTAGPVDHERHPELNVLDFFDNVAIYLTTGNLREDMVMQAGAQLMDHLWPAMAPTIAIMRRQRGPQLYSAFEYLVQRSRQWLARYPGGCLPKNFRRLPISDVWLQADEAHPT